jgi:hypothetical protein
MRGQLNHRLVALLGQPGQRGCRVRRAAKDRAALVNAMQRDDDAGLAAFLPAASVVACSQHVLALCERSPI